MAYTVRLEKRVDNKAKKLMKQLELKTFNSLVVFMLQNWSELQDKLSNFQHRAKNSERLLNSLVTSLESKTKAEQSMDDVKSILEITNIDKTTPAMVKKLEKYISSIKEKNEAEVNLAKALKEFHNMQSS